VKFVVTEELKSQLLAEARQAEQVLDTRIQQMDVEGRRVVEHIQREDVLRAGQIREQLEQEKQALLQRRREVTGMAREIQSLSIGDEVTRGTAEELVEVQVGDPQSKVVGASEIVIRDGAVVELREGVAADDEGGEVDAAAAVELQ
jgi:hypothetical protein